MDLLKVFKKKYTSKEVKEKFMTFSVKTKHINKAQKYLKKLCKDSPKKCIGYKKIFFTVYKDIETEIAVQMGDEIVEELKDNAFVKVLAIRHKRLGNITRYEELVKIGSASKETFSTQGRELIKNKDVKNILQKCTGDIELKHTITNILDCDEKDRRERYKLIFTGLEGRTTTLEVKYGMLYFRENPFDREFVAMLRARVEELKSTEDIRFIVKYDEHYKYITNLLKGKFFNAPKFDKKKFQQQLAIVSGKVPSIFIQYYISFTIKKYHEDEEQISKEVMQVLKDKNTALALRYGKVYLDKNKQDVKFKKVLVRREKLYKKEKSEKAFVDNLSKGKLFSSEKLVIKSYISLLVKTAKKYDDSVLTDVVNMFLNKFLLQKEQILRNTFSVLKDSHSEMAAQFGILYVENNLKDIKFAKVLLKRLQKLGENEKHIMLAKKLYAFTNDESFDYIVVADDINRIIDKCELLYSENKKRVLSDNIEQMIIKYPKYEALIYRKLLKFYSKRDYKRAEKYALKSLKIQANEYVIKELYDLHITHGFIQKALSVLPKNPTMELLKIKKKNGTSLYHLVQHGFDLPLKKVKNYRPKKKKVFYLLHNRLPYNSGGYATRSHGLLTGVSVFGWDMHGVSRLGYPLDRMPDIESFPTDMVDNIQYHRLLNGEIGLGSLPLKEYLESYADALLALAKKEKPEMIHAASNYMNGIVGNYVAKSLGIPSIYEVRGLWEITRISRESTWKDSEYYNLMAKMEADAAKGADIVFTLTEALRDEMVSRGVDREKIHLLPNGVVSDRFVPLVKNNTLAKSLKIEGKTIVGFIGSFAQYEGLEYIVDAMEILINKGRTDIVALMVGDGAVAEEIRARVTSKGLDKYFVFTGRIPHDEVEEYYSLVDIAPLPRKGLPVCEMVSPLKPFEAMAMEKVVLSSNVAALAEIVKDNYNGMLFEKDNVDDLAKKIELLADNPKLREKLGKQARQWVVEERDWGKIAKNLDVGYSKIRKKI